MRGTNWSAGTWRPSLGRLKTVSSQPGPGRIIGKRAGNLLQSADFDVLSQACRRLEYGQHPTVL